jgi:hypothetical protein
MNDVPVDRQLFTVGYLAQMFQRRPDELRAMLAAAGIKPAQSVNDLVHYDGYAIIAISRALKEAAGNE